MDRQLIKALIDALAASDLSELEYTHEGATLRLSKAAPARSGVATAPPAPAVAASPLPPPPPSAPPKAQAAVVSAPLYGVVHLQRSAESPPLIAVGDSVVAGQALCLIEAMKVFTELCAERDGVVAAILVESGQEVEAGQPLFRLTR